MSNSSTAFPLDDDDNMPPVHAHAPPPRATAPVKVVNDPIHGHFELPHHVVQVIDTPHVQRLRDLKQLGGTYLVYPGASHNRFEHSLGVSHLSRAFVSALYHNPRHPHARLLFDGRAHFDDAVKLVELAGLAHDLGHGPFSHMFDHVFLPAAARARRLPHTPLMHHEARSVALFEHCVDKYAIDLDRDAVRHVGALIRGEKDAPASLTPRFVFDVVANSATGIDTDKFDYLARDVYNLGLKAAYGFDHARLIKFAKVVDDDICFHRKEVFNVYHLFLTRFQLHRTVYNHRAALAIDAMITDAFIEADPVFNIFDSIHHPADFLTMTDSLLPMIERSKEYALRNARHIIHRLRRRKLYRFVEESLLPAGRSMRVTPEDIVACQDAGDVQLTPDDVHVAHVTLNFGMKDQNPVDHVKFFKQWEDDTPVQLTQRNVSYVIPQHFEEKIIRVFMKREHDEDNAVRRAISKAFRKFMRRHDLGESLNSPIFKDRSTRRTDKLDGDDDDDGLTLGESASSRLAKRQRANV